VVDKCFTFSTHVLFESNQFQEFREHFVEVEFFLNKCGESENEKLFLKIRAIPKPSQIKNNSAWGQSLQKIKIEEDVQFGDV